MSPRMLQTRPGVQKSRLGSSFGERCAVYSGPQGGVQGGGVLQAGAGRDQRQGVDNSPWRSISRRASALKAGRPSRIMGACWEKGHDTPVHLKSAAVLSHRSTFHEKSNHRRKTQKTEIKPRHRWIFRVSGGFMSVVDYALLAASVVACLNTIFVQIASSPPMVTGALIGLTYCGIALGENLVISPRCAFW